jgi:hypothetical protein
MTLKEVQQLIDGEVYLFKYEGRTIKRMFLSIQSNHYPKVNFTQHYALLGTYEPNRFDYLYRIEELELIGAYQTERDADCL